MQGPDNRKIKTEFIAPYLSDLNGQVNGSISYLNQTISWQIAIFIGGSLASSAFQSADRYYSLFIAISLLAITLHNGARAAKAYINVIRFSVLRRSVVKLIVDRPEGDEFLYEIENIDVAKKIQLFDIEWHSPISRKAIVYKVLIELGFVYQLLIILAILAYISITKFLVLEQISILGITLAIFGILLLELFRSPYLRKVSIDSEAEQLR